MKTMLKNLTLVMFTVVTAAAYCPNEGDPAQPKGLRRTGTDAVYKRTPPFGGALVVFTEQDDHEFTPKEDDVIVERIGARRAPMHHTRCTACNTYNIFNKCGYTLIDDGQ